MSIKVDHLSKQYGEQVAVNQISFEVQQGEIVGFLGPNGAGKSTTMKMITGYLASDGGEVYVSGIKVEGEAIETKKRIGYLPESNPLYLEMYVREYLQFIGELHHVVGLKQRIEEVIAIVGLAPESNKQIGQLSKGYKQRVGLAAALIHDPEVLILDEPTTGLDPNQIKEIREVIKDLGKRKTILFSTHIMQEVEALCDRVIVINKGTIVADDQLSVLKAGNETTTVRVQFNEEIELELIKKLPNLIKIDHFEAKTWEIQAENAENLSKELMSFALQHNLNIVSLHTQTRRLEDIFSELTGKNN